MRFQTKLLLAFLSTSLVSIGLMFLLNLRSERQFVKEVEANIREILEIVYFSSNQLSNERFFDLNHLNRFITDVKTYRSVREVSIINRHLQVILSSNPKHQGMFFDLQRDLLIQEKQNKRIYPSLQHMQYEITIPLRVGWAHLSISFEDLGLRLKRLYVKNLAIGFFALFVSFVTSFLVLNQLNRPLRALEQAANRISAGDLSIRLPVNGRDEVAKLSASFNEMTGQLAEQKQLEERLAHLEKKSILAEMVATLAHEIRNPLNLINLTVDHFASLERKPEQQELINNLKAEVRHLNQMVNNFIAFGQPVKLNRTRFPLADLFHQVQILVRQQLVAKKISVGLSGAVQQEVRADLEQLRLVFINLFLNAIQAAAEGGYIHLAADYDLAGKRVLIEMADNGPGIAPEDLPHLFEPYFSRQPGGTGLGLALVKRIVDEHGGTITARNRLADVTPPAVGPSTGAVFTITLPQEG